MKPVLYEVGNRYQTISGKLVKIVMSHGANETVLGDDGLARFNRPKDLGRVAGTPNDMSCPANLVQLFTHHEQTVNEGQIYDIVTANSLHSPQGDTEGYVMVRQDHCIKIFEAIAALLNKKVQVVE